LKYYNRNDKITQRTYVPKQWEVLMKRKIINILKNSNTLPFLFAGSGLSRRYIGLEGWEGLLKKFAYKASEQEFAYNIFLQQAEIAGNKEGVLPKVAELIENEFNQIWYKSEFFSDSRNRHKEDIDNNISPFKLEIADYMRAMSSDIDEQYTHEVELLKQLGNKSVAGIITTNYDLFLENVFDNFTTYIGQEELIFSQLQGVSEIYKIHGSAVKPESIVINEKDYVDFSERNAYLAAKLLTIFLEHPIVFIGYSISDKNIESILKAIVKCLSQEHLEMLKERLIFIEWAEGGKEEISTYSKAFEGDKSIDMTRVRLNDYCVLYEALFENKAKYNVSMLRQLKKDIYELVMTNKPTGKMRVIGLEDDARLDQVEMVLGVGVISEFGQKGYLGITADEIYEDIILDNGDFEVDRIVNDTLPNLLPKNSSLLPVYKYLEKFEGYVPAIIEEKRKKRFDELLNNTIIRNRGGNTARNSNLNELMEEYSTRKCIYLLPYMKPENIDLRKLELLLKKVFTENEKVWISLESGYKSDFKRAIRIYDLLKYGNIKELQI